MIRSGSQPRGAGGRLCECFAFHFGSWNGCIGGFVNESVVDAGIIWR